MLITISPESRSPSSESAQVGTLSVKYLSRGENQCPPFYVRLDYLYATAKFKSCPKRNTSEKCFDEEPKVHGSGVGRPLCPVGALLRWNENGRRAVQRMLRLQRENQQDEVLRQMDEILDKLQRIRQLWKKQERIKIGTAEHEAVMEQIRALSAEYQALIEHPKAVNRNELLPQKPIIPTTRFAWSIFHIRGHANQTHSVAHSHSVPGGT